jgi:thioredoxin reductase (NADPH)
LERTTLNKKFDVIIIGAGPAGLTAAIYLLRMNMRILVLEKKYPGGRANLAPIIENFPGFEEGIKGTKLTNKMVNHIKKLGGKINFPEEIMNILFSGKTKTVVTRLSKYETSGLIITTGIQRRKLLVSGEAEFIGSGVSYCTVCDGPLFKNKITAVIGAGNEAFMDCLFLSDYSKKVYLITGQDEIEATKSLIDKCQEKENVKILRAKINSIIGKNVVTSIKILDLKSKKNLEVPVNGVFFSAGEIPLNNFVKRTGIEVDEKGCIKVDRKQRTNIEGVFAAGDCTCGGMQIITSAGEGAMAALQAYRYVKTFKK